VGGELKGGTDQGSKVTLIIQKGGGYLEENVGELE